MLNRPPRDLQSLDEMDWKQEDARGFDLERLLAATRRRAWIVLLCVIAGGALGVAFLLVAIPKYTAATDVMIDERRLSAMADAYALDAAGTQTGGLESEIELIHSERVAGRVVDALGLTTDTSFNSPGSTPLRGIIQSLRKWVPLPDWFESEPVTKETLQRSRDAALGALRNNLAVSRVGLSHVLQIRYTDDDANEAARIANAYAKAYLTDQMESTYDATRSASEWLQARIQELEQKSEAADLAVQQFMIVNNLSDSASDAVSGQQLTGVNAQLIAARGATAEAKARLQRVQAILDSDDMNAAITETLQNSIITNLRGRYLDASKRLGELEPLLGPDHLQVVNLTNDMHEYQRMMFDELGRIAESYKSEYAIAKSREDALDSSLSALTGTSGNDAREVTELRELQRDAETMRTLHQTYLQRYQAISQQESFPITDARVLNAAAVPGAPSEPQGFSVLRTYLVFGALIGAALAAFAEYRDRAFRTGQQVREELGLEFLGMLPLVGKAAQKKSRRRKRGPGKPDPDVEPERQVADLAPISRYVLDQPLSGFAETLRAAKIGADLTLGKKAGKIIGVTSVLPGEGKSTVAKNLASLLASQGKRTLLIDADLRNPGLSREIAKSAEAGILEALMEGGKALEDLILYEAGTKLAILPAVVKRRNSSHTSDVLASSGMRNLLEQASQHYEYIIVDLPPMGPVVDVRAVASYIDSFLFVVAWGSTARKVVRDTLQAAPAVYDKCLGVVLNKVDPNKLKLYESYGSSGYYYGRYSSYYRN